MSNSKKLFLRATKVIPSGINSPVRFYDPYPFFVKKANGSVIWDVDGNRYLDFCNGYGALLLGHRRKEILSAVLSQLKNGTLYCAPTEIEVELSELIVRNYPSMGKVRLVNTGSEATMTAIRLARGFTKKKKIIKFEGCYHGAHDSVLVKAGSGAAHAPLPHAQGLGEHDWARPDRSGASRGGGPARAWSLCVRRGGRSSSAREKTPRSGIHRVATGR